MATGGSDLTSDEIVSWRINIKCCICAEENKTREAEKYCIECMNYYCSSCVGIHQKVPPMKGHKVMNKGDFRSMGPDGGLPSHPTQRCDQHPLKVVDMYCKDHDEVACASCIALSFSHRSCKNIVSISDEIEQLYQAVNFDDIKRNICDAKKTIEEIKTSKKSKIKELGEALKREIDSVKAYREEVQALLDKMEQETIKELKGEFSRIEGTLASNINQDEVLLSSLNEAASQLEMSKGNKAQQFVCVKSSQKLIEQGKELEKTQQTAKDESVSFTPDKTISVYLQQIKALGRVSNNPKKSLYMVKKQREIDVKLANDMNSCSIWGSCITEDDSLLLADYNNKRLKRMDINTEKVNDYLDLQDSPRAVCTVSKNEAAVALENKTVQFVSLGDKMTTTRHLTMSHKCFGLAHLNGKLIVSDFSKTVFIYETNGQEMCRISTDGTTKGLFTQTNYISASASGEKVIVSDLNNGVIVLDSHGSYLSTHHNKNVSGYYGVCTDSKNVFVSGWSSNNIVQYGEDLKMLGELAKLKNLYLTTLCFDHKHTRLVATVYSNDKIIILELE